MTGINIKSTKIKMTTFCLVFSTKFTLVLVFYVATKAEIMIFQVFNAFSCDAGVFGVINGREYP